MVVLDDADMDVAVDACINGSFYSTGQRCTASSRLIVGRGIHDSFVEAMHARMRVLKVGNPPDSQTQIGPVVDSRQLGGRKKSSYGAREQGSYAQEFFTTVKTAYIAAGIVLPRFPRPIV